MNALNEPPKSVWKKERKGTRGLVFWALMVIGVAFVFAVGVVELAGARLGNTVAGSVLVAMLIFVGMTIGVFAFYRLIRWLCRPRHLRRSLFAVACLVTLVALFYAEEDLRGKWEWDRFKRAWQAKGEHFQLIHLAPPPVPDDQNFATAPMVASSYLYILHRDGTRRPHPDTNIVDRLEMPVTIDEGELRAPDAGDWRTGRLTDLKAWQLYYRQAAKRTNEFPVPTRPGTPAADVLLALSKYDPALAELRQAAKRPYSRFPLDYDAEMPNEIFLPHLACLKSCAQMLDLRACTELADGQSDGALADVGLMLRLSGAIHTEPFLISQLVRIALTAIAIQPIWEGTVQHRWTDGQLAALERELSRLDFLADYRLGMRGELAYACGAIEFYRHDPGNVLRYPSLTTVAPRGWYYQNELHSARAILDWLLPLADMRRGEISPSAAERANAVLRSETAHVGPYNFLQRLVSPAFATAAERFACAQAGVDLARTACALERYRIAHGRYPETLEALVPQFIGAVPHDVVNGQPLHYRLTGNGDFLLYSVGWNEKDDGGAVVMHRGGTPPVDISKGDWVWKFPTK